MNTNWLGRVGVGWLALRKVDMMGKKGIQEDRKA